MWPLIKLLPVKTNFRFVSFAKFAGLASVLAVCASIFLALYPLTPPCGGLNCGIDFTGGTLLEISTAPEAVDLAKVRGELGEMDLGDVQVQAFGAPTSALVRFQTPEGESSEQAIAEVKTALTGALGEVVFAKTEVVGPKVSGELFQSGLLALGVAIGLMMLYIWFRFELQFGVGAVVGLFHDVILALTGLAIFGGATLFAFSVIMIFGVVIGTYSSIYVAAPVILLWGVKRGEEDEAEPLPIRT